MATATNLAPVSTAIESFHEGERAKDLLRFTTAGSVDDGKSTLIGRLLYDSRNVYEDQIESVSKASAGRNAGAIDFSLLTDGLRAEREQGITIDVAHRYFTTPKRKFIIADTPGHEQYTRNMVTGASTAELAIVLVDARKGLLAQSRRHAYIASLLGLQHVVVAVNKMDLVGYDGAVFAQIERDFQQFLRPFQTLEPFFLPISALEGDNVVHRSRRMPWFDGPSLLEYLEDLPLERRVSKAAFRFPVQRVVRPGHSFRGYAGTVAAGEVTVGDSILVLPSAKRTQVAEISTFDGNLLRANAGQAITLVLADDVDVSRGDVLVSPEEQPAVTKSFTATLVWLNEQPADLNKRYRLKQNTRQDWAEIKEIDYRININTLAHESANTLEMNAIGVAAIETARPLIFDGYRANRITGSFILIDPVTNATVAAGLIERSRDPLDGETQQAAKISWHVTENALILQAAGQQLSMGSGEIRSTDDPETAELVARLLKRLGLSFHKEN
ncbi:MAG TPA: sulfate adenylyltransferase subunit CysN [Bryobacteraceae bacterium]|nr:sulfate adenylyltransferase subunit CysN [Bryobacteraceae bacterium]